MNRGAALAVFAFACTVQAGTAPPGGDARHADVRHELEVRFDEQLRLTAAVDRIHIRAGALTSPELSPALTVDRLSVDGRQIDPADTSWHERLDPGEEHVLVFEYREGAPPPDGPGGHAGGRFLSGTDLAPQISTALVSFDIRVEAPAGQVAIAPGKIVSEETEGKTARARFVSEGPTDDIALFIGPYVLTERMHRGRRLRAYLHPQVAELADLYLTKVGEYIDLYDKSIGRYAFSQFFVVSGVHPVGLGLPGLTYIGVDVLRLPFIPDTSLGHEVLHCWWGNGVLPDTSEGNWVEGLTTFLADYAYAAREGEEAARDMRLRWLRGYAVLPQGEDRPLTAFRARRHTASQVVGYHKAAMLFLMLREELGAERFDEGLRRFWRERRFRRATWTDLRSAFEAEAGRSLQSFFSQWLQRAGAPDLQLREVHAQEGLAGPTTVRFVLAQPEPPYDLRVPIEIRTRSGTVRDSVRLRNPATEFEVDVPAAPVSLTVDPDFRLFRRLHADEVPPILRSVAFDPEAVTVVAARDSRTRAVARDLAAAFFERTPSVHVSAEPWPAGPVLVVGSTQEVARLLPKLGLSSAPPRVALKGSARAWAARRENGEAAVVVAADDESALRAVVRPLPHYGSQSFVVFEGRRAVDRGLAAAAGRGPLHFAFAEDESAGKR